MHQKVHKQESVQIIIDKLHPIAFFKQDFYEKQVGINADIKFDCPARVCMYCSYHGYIDYVNVGLRSLYDLCSYELFPIPVM